MVKKAFRVGQGKRTDPKARDSARRLGRRVGAAMVFVHLLPGLIPEAGLRAAWRS